MFEVGVGRFRKGEMLLVIGYMHMHIYLTECRIIITVLY